MGYLRGVAINKVFLKMSKKTKRKKCPKVFSGKIFDIIDGYLRFYCELKKKSRQNYLLIYGGKKMSFLKNVCISFCGEKNQ